MTVKIFSAVMKGCDSIPVAVTVTCEEGQGISISGLITETVHRDMSRLQFALLNCGFGFKRKKLHIDIEPAIFDYGESLMLAIAVAILMATGKISYNDDLENYCIVGGLGVTGNIHEIDDAARMAGMALSNGFKIVVLPDSNIRMPDFGYSRQVYAVRHLNSLVTFLNKKSLNRKMELPSALFEHLNYN